MSDTQSEMRQEANRQAEAMTSAGDRLSELAHEKAELETALAQAEANYKGAWSDATRAGWTPAQLKSFGFKQPTTQQRRRPRKRSTTPPLPHEDQTDVHAS